MSKQSVKGTHFHGTPASMRREIEEQRQLAETISSDLAFVGNAIKTLFSRITDVVKSVRVGNFINTQNTRDAS